MFKLIDEAWSKRGNRLANDSWPYIIDMGREIGTKGETSGALMKYLRKELIVRGYRGPNFGHPKNGKLHAFEKKA